MGLSFRTAAVPRQHNHSWVRVLRGPWPYFTVSDSRLPQPGGPGPDIYIPQEQDGPVIPLGTGFRFLRLRLAGLWCRYSNPPPHGVVGSRICRAPYIPSQDCRIYNASNNFRELRGHCCRNSTSMWLCIWLSLYPYNICQNIRCSAGDLNPTSPEHEGVDTIRMLRSVWMMKQEG
jgi:hypothetical protein